MVDSLHYLDDFLLLGPPDYPICAEVLRILLQLSEELGVLVAGGKTEGPTTLLEFLGIEIDTELLQMRLPQAKLKDFISRRRQWMREGAIPTPLRSGMKRDLLSQIGLLNHVATVVKPGQTFLGSLIDASSTVKSLEHHVHLSAHASVDLVWWYTSYGP